MYKRPVDLNFLSIIIDRELYIHQQSDITRFDCYAEKKDYPQCINFFESYRSYKVSDLYMQSSR